MPRPAHCDTRPATALPGPGPAPGPGLGLCGGWEFGRARFQAARALVNSEGRRAVAKMMRKREGLLGVAVWREAGPGRQKRHVALVL
uniref:Uncharacterized protein n=1 Tax=Rangifer tarandus platyrhynchus TaxID=3082113 RepID=A0ACB0F5L5_RANTA|nr:unnamed protein product [Rangifer tarandus platyrhynchus]